jgi:hypothetical protein
MALSVSRGNVSAPLTSLVPVIRRAKRISAPLLLAGLSLFTVRSSLADPAGTLINPRWNHTATRLLDGRVLVAGGFVQVSDCCFGNTAACEIYNPATNMWTATGSLNQARDGQQAVLMADGCVLAASGRIEGNFQTKTAEIYEPATGTWSLTQSTLDY